mgnify:CR=1 FL=1
MHMALLLPKVVFWYNKNKERKETLCRRFADFGGIKISINWRDPMPPHFHASYGEDEVIVSILDIEVLEGSMPSKQLKMLLGWAAFHQDELMENWELAQKKQELFEIEPLK